MALSIRLRKTGRINQQKFRIVVIDKKAPRDGKYIENVGWYDPHQKEEKNLFVKSEKIEFWLDKGAQMSPSVEDLVKRFSPEIIKKEFEKKLAKKKKLRLKKIESKKKK